MAVMAATVANGAPARSSPAEKAATAALNRNILSNNAAEEARARAGQEAYVQQVNKQQVQYDEEQKRAYEQQIRYDGEQKRIYEQQKAYTQQVTQYDQQIRTYEQQKAQYEQQLKQPGL
jgi:hypothetical protein